MFGKEEVRELLADLDTQDGVVECPVVTLARLQGKLPFDPKAITCCFAYYYYRGRQNPYLRAAIEEGLIEYVDISGWTTLSETPFYLHVSAQTGKKWEYTQVTEEQKQWIEEKNRTKGIW